MKKEIKKRQGNNNMPCSDPNPYASTTGTTSRSCDCCCPCAPICSFPPWTSTNPWHCEGCTWPLLQILLMRLACSTCYWTLSSRTIQKVCPQWVDHDSKIDSNLGEIHPTTTWHIPSAHLPRPLSASCRTNHSPATASTTKHERSPGIGIDALIFHHLGNLGKAPNMTSTILHMNTSRLFLRECNSTSNDVILPNLLVRTSIPLS